MAHVFATGSTIPTRRAVRQFVMQALAPMLRSSGRYLAATVEIPFSMRLLGPEDEAIASDLIGGQSPAIGVAIGNANFDDRSPDGRLWTGALQVALYVFVRHQRSAMSSVAGDVLSQFDVTKDPGIETILQHSIELLAGRDTQIPEAPSLVPESEELVFVGDGWQIWEQLYRARTTFTAMPDREGISATAIEINSDQEPGPSLVTLIDLEEA